MSVVSHRGYGVVALDHPKSPYNLSACLRAVHVHGASMLVYSGKRVTPNTADPYRTYRYVPLLRVDDVFDTVPYDCVPVAVDLVADAIPLPDYQHPDRAFYVFGAEDATLGARILSRCRDVVMVPTNGCMNLAATVNVVLYDRNVKRRCVT